MGYFIGSSGLLLILGHYLGFVMVKSPGVLTRSLSDCWLAAAQDDIPGCLALANDRSQSRFMTCFVWDTLQAEPQS